MSKRSNETLHLGSIASQFLTNTNPSVTKTNVKQLHVPGLFDSRANDNQNNVRLRTNDTLQLHANVENERKNEQLHVNIDANHRPVKAIHPVINSEVFALTMDRYRIYVKKLNDFRRNENENIKKHNKEAAAFEPNALQKPFIDLFLQKNRNLSPSNYNKAVTDLQNERGIVLKKKRLHIIKYQSELIFQQFLYEYSLQLNENTKVFKKLGVNDARRIKMLEINSAKIVLNTRNGIQSIDVCNETIKNHRKHLEEAKVLVDYVFCGHKRGIKCHINPEILATFDLKTQKITITENQHFTPKTAKSFGNNKDVTVTLHKENEIKENVDNNSLRKGNATLLQDETISNNNNDINTGLQFEKRQTGAAEKFVKLSEKFQQNVENEYKLAENLKNGLYNFYKPIDVRELYNEAMYGILSREEFKEVILQDFFKTSAKLYRNSTPYFGSWLKAYQNWMKKMFFSGKETLIHKTTMVERLQEYRWRLNHAHKWFTKHSEVNILFPSDYFDFTRLTAKECGFEYTKKAYKKHLKYESERISIENEQNRNAKQRKERINHAKKFETAFNKFKNNKLTLNQFYDYVKTNLPAQYQMTIVERIKEYTSKTI